MKALEGDGGSRRFFHLRPRTCDSRHVVPIRPRTLPRSWFAVAYAVVHSRPTVHVGLGIRFPFSVCL